MFNSKRRLRQSLAVVLSAALVLCSAPPSFALSPATEALAGPPSRSGGRSSTLPLVALNNRTQTRLTEEALSASLVGASWGRRVRQWLLNSRILLSLSGVRTQGGGKYLRNVISSNLKITDGMPFVWHKEMYSRSHESQVAMVEDVLAETIARMYPDRNLGKKPIKFAFISSGGEENAIYAARKNGLFSSTIYLDYYEIADIVKAIRRGPPEQARVAMWLLEFRLRHELSHSNQVAGTRFILIGVVGAVAAGLIGYFLSGDIGGLLAIVSAAVGLDGVWRHKRDINEEEHLIRLDLNRLEELPESDRAAIVTRSNVMAFVRAGGTKLLGYQNYLNGLLTGVGADEETKSKVVKALTQQATSVLWRGGLRTMSAASSTDDSSEAIRLTDAVTKLSRVPGGIEAGVGLPDYMFPNRTFTPDGRYFTPEGQFGQELQDFIASLEKQDVQQMIANGIMYYDSRSKLWKDHPEYTVVFALAFAKKIQEKSGKKDGHVIHLAVDAYEKHFEAAQVFADALLRTGITDNGGGVIFWGVRNGGFIRNQAQLYDAQNKNGGHWVFFTQSHRTEDTILGAKIGIEGKVYCGPDIRHVDDVQSGTLFDAIIDPINGHAPIQHPASGVVVNVGNTLPNDIKVAADMIRATAARGKEAVPDHKLLDGVQRYVAINKNPIVKQAVDLLRGLGATVTVDSEEIDQHLAPNEDVIDPNEHTHGPVMKVRSTVKALAVQGGPRSAHTIDPDGDRSGVADMNGDNPEPETLRGSQLLHVVLHALAMSGKSITVVCDMRGALSIQNLAEALRKEGHNVRVVPKEAGYPFFMIAMSELPAHAAIEDTLHFFTNPMTDLTWGAPEQLQNWRDGKGYQGGDDAAQAAAFIDGASKYLWEGRNAVEQYHWLLQHYNLARTEGNERKPTLPHKDDDVKYEIAREMQVVAKEWFGRETKVLIDMNDPASRVISGVHLTVEKDGKPIGMVLARYSNSGPGFTISGEAYRGPAGHEMDLLHDMLALGQAVMEEAVNRLRAKGREFDLNWKDANDLRGTFDPAKLGLGSEGKQPELRDTAADEHREGGKHLREATEAMDALMREDARKSLVASAGDIEALADGARGVMPTYRTYATVRSWFPKASPWVIRILTGLIAPFHWYEKWMLLTASHERIRQEEHEGDRAVAAYWLTRVASVLAALLGAYSFGDASSLGGIMVGFAVAVFSPVLASVPIQLLANTAYMIGTGLQSLYRGWVIPRREAAYGRAEMTLFDTAS